MDELLESIDKLISYCSRHYNCYGFIPSLKDLRVEIEMNKTVYNNAEYTRNHPEVIEEIKLSIRKR
jgi:hypothetical protein